MAATEGLGRNVIRERITVALIAKAADDLRRTHERSGLSKTDIVNRAISLYEFVDSHVADGDEFILCSKATGELERIRFL